MNGRKNRIGFSQRIRLEWFERTAHLALAGNDRTVIHDSLQDLLRDKVSIGGRSLRCNREKIISILLKTWFAAPRALEELRDEGLEILQRLPREDRIAVHWGMTLAAYPFWGAVAAHTGRLLRLQGTAAAAHVQRRIREEYGERATVSRAAQRVLRSFIDWGVLHDTLDKGVYGQGKQYSLEDPGLIAWMAEAHLRARGNGPAAIADWLASPSLFPFRLARGSAVRAVSLSPRLLLVRHGLDEDLVTLRQVLPKRGR